MTATTRPAHLYQADYSLPADHKGEPLCTCGRPKKNQRHDLPDVDPAAQAEQNRRLGERNTDE